VWGWPFCYYSVDYIFKEFLAVDISDYFFLEKTTPKIINIMPTAIDVPFFDEPNMLGSKKSTPASIQSVGTNLCNIGLLFPGEFFIFHSNLTYLQNKYKYT
jgi:hypothetical protein